MIHELFQNHTLIVSAISWALAQILKVVVIFIVNQKADWRMLVSSGGMPSSHSSFVSSMAVFVGLTQGFDSVLFAICAVFCFVVMYDAAGVRRAAGLHAAIINKILVKAETDFNIRIDANLKELLGHTPFQVIIGGFLGVGIAIAYYYLVYLA